MIDFSIYFQTLVLEELLKFQRITMEHLIFILQVITKIIIQT